MQSRMASMASVGSLNVDRMSMGAMPPDMVREVIPEAPNEGLHPSAASYSPDHIEDFI